MSHGVVVCESQESKTRKGGREEREGGRKGGREEREGGRKGGREEREGGRKGGRQGGTHLSNNILEGPPLLTLLRHHQVGINSAGLEAFVLLGGKVQILKAKGGVGGVVPGDAELALEVVHQADAGT